MTDPNLFQLPVNIETPRNDKNRVATIRAGYAREKAASEAGVRATKRGEIPFAYEELTYECRNFADVDLWIDRRACS
jgi:hypothetical protein